MIVLSINRLSLISLNGLGLVKLSSFSFLIVSYEFLSFLLFYVLIRGLMLCLGFRCDGSTIFMLNNGCFNFKASIFIFLRLSEATYPIASLMTREVEPYFLRICDWFLLDLFSFILISATFYIDNYFSARFFMA